MFSFSKHTAILSHSILTAHAVARNHASFVELDLRRTTLAQ